MRFAVKAWSIGRARAGVLHLDCCPIPSDTPSLLLSTRKGLPLFISPDLLPSLPSPDSHLLHLGMKTISKIGGLHQMLGLHEYGFVAFPRDFIQCLSEANGTNKIKPVEYMEMISFMRPELWAPVAHEVPAWVSDKRNKTSVDRTIKCLMNALHSARQVELFLELLFEVLVWKKGNNVPQRRWVFGFFIVKGLNERDSSEEKIWRNLEAAVAAIFAVGMDNGIGRVKSAKYKYADSWVWRLPHPK